MKKIKEYWQKNPRKRKLVVVAMVVVGMSLSFGLYALAQSFIDSFSDTTRISKTWNANVDTTAGEIKSVVKTCDNGTWFCSANNVCANTLGDGNYIVVKRTDVSGTKKWKTTSTDCSRPECGVDGAQSTDNLVADNTVLFPQYPARDACKAVGGRLPTKTELQCIYNNRATFGNNFVAYNYWSGTEGSTTLAWNVYFPPGLTYNDTKAYSCYVRCVLGW